MSELTPLQRAALTIKQLRAKLDGLENKVPDPVAVVSMSCRFPGSPDLEAFWEILKNGVDAVQEVPKERWDLEEWFDPRPETPGKINTRYGGFIDGVDLFDADFFSIPPNEAKRMDPGQRILLELVWEALERAYIPPDSLRGSRTGFFVGMNQNDYGVMQISGDPEEITAYTGTGNGLCFTSGRVSYQFGFHGPTLSSDTACSSSMVALHQAVQAIRNHECEVAIVAGVQLNLTPSQQVFFSRTQSFSPHGRCFAFDKKADGFVLGEGVGVVVLASQKTAMSRKYPVLATILSTAINHGGAAPGLTVPSESAQETVIRDCLVKGGIDPDSVDYIETHGTGTQLGDPIEIGALRSVFGKRDSGHPLRIGSAKTNIGHLNATSGLAGFIKTVLMLQHESMVPTLHYHTPNPDIPWEGFPVEIPVNTQDWKSNSEHPRRAGVSSFGLSGTNTHVTLQEAEFTLKGAKTVEGAADPNAQPTLTGHKELFVISAKNEKGLKDLASGHLELAKTKSDREFASLCYSASAGRSHHAFRLAIECENTAEWVQSLGTYLQGDVDSRTRLSTPDRRITASKPWILSGNSKKLCDGLIALYPSLSARKEKWMRMIELQEQAKQISPSKKEEFVSILTTTEFLMSLGIPVSSLSGVKTGLLAAALLAEAVAADDVAALLSSEHDISITIRRPKIAVLHPNGEKLERISTRDLQEVPDPVHGYSDSGTVYVIGDEVLSENVFVHGVDDLLKESPGKDDITLLRLRDWLCTLMRDVYLSGITPDWNLFYKDRRVHWVPLPTYAFQRKRFWLDKPVSKSNPTSQLLLESEDAAADQVLDAMKAQLAETSKWLEDITQSQFEALQKQLTAIPEKSNSDIKNGTHTDPESLTMTQDQQASILQCGEWNLEWLPTSRLNSDAADYDTGYLLYQTDEDPVEIFAQSDKKRVVKSARQSEPALIMMFPGVGDHYLNMGRGLYRHHPVFRSTMDECNKITTSLLGLNLLEILYPELHLDESEKNTSPTPQSPAFDLRAMLGRSEQKADPATETLNRTLHSQPLVFMIEYALAQLWLSLGIKPAAMIGYSIGEYTAAVLSGVMSLEDALRLIIKRAQLIDSMAPGVMLAVPLPAQEIRPFLSKSLSVAIESTPSQTVIAGPEEAICELEHHLTEREVTMRRLQSSHAFHSTMLKSLHDPLVELVSEFSLSEPHIPYLSNVTGDWIRKEQVLQPAYWAEHTWNTVKFSQGLSQLLDPEQIGGSKNRLFLEVGPGVSLGSFMLQHPAGAAIPGKRNMPSLKTMYERMPDEQFLLQSIGRLWLAGVSVNHSHEPVS